MIKYYLKHIKDVRKNYIGYICYGCLLWGLGISTPIIKGNIIDAAIETEKQLLIYNAQLFLLITVLKVAFNYFYDKNKTITYSFMSYSANKEILEKMHRESIIMFEKKSMLEAFHKNYKDIAIIISFFVDTLSTFIQNILTICVLIVWTSKIDIIILILFLFLCTSYSLIFLLLKNSLYVRYEDMKKLFSKYTSEIAKQYINNKFIKANGMEKLCNSYIFSAYQKYRNKQLEMQKMDYVFNCMSAIFGFLSQLFLYMWGGMMVIQGKMSIGTLLILVSYFDMILSSICFFLSVGKKYQNTISSFNNIREYLNKRQNVNVIPQLKEITTINKISLKNITFAFENKIILKNFCMEFVKGKSYCLTGKNGIGKSTLINLMIGLYNNDYEGEIEYDNSEMRYLNMENIRKYHIGVVEQTPVMFFETVKENIYFKEFNSKGKMQYIKWIDEYLDKRKERNPHNLSGGEKQKIAIARQFCENVKILILDEPTSMLDVETKQKFLRLLPIMKENRIVIVVSHDKDIVESCDYHINMEVDSICN